MSIILTVVIKSSVQIYKSGILNRDIFYVTYNSRNLSYSVK